MKVTVKLEKGVGRMKKILAMAFEKTSNDILHDSKINCPVETGRLRRSLNLKKVKENKFAVQSEVPYANRVEYGFVGRDKLGRNYIQKPAFFVRRAIFKNIIKMRDNIKMFSK